MEGTWKGNLGSTSAVNTSATFVYADDTAFLVNTIPDTVSTLRSFQDTASALGLRISWPKTKLQNLGAGHQPPSVSVDGNAV